MLIFLCTTAVGTTSPTMLSLGLVTIGGDDHYAELDGTSLAAVQQRLMGEGQCDTAILRVFGQRSRGAGTPHDLAQSTLRWLLQLHEGLAAGAEWAGVPVDKLQIAFAREMDFDLLSRDLQACDPALWRLLRERITPRDVSWIRGHPDLDRSGLPQDPLCLESPDALCGAQSVRKAYLVATARGLAPGWPVMRAAAQTAASKRDWQARTSHRPR